MTSVERRLIVAGFLLLVSSGRASGQSPRPMTLVDLLDVPAVSEPRVSPGGDRLLYVVARADWKVNKRISHIWRVNADGSGTTQLTNGGDGETSPRWSPDGRRVAFLAKRSENRENQIYVIPTDEGEARPAEKEEEEVLEEAHGRRGRAEEVVEESECRR